MGKLIEFKPRKVNHKNRLIVTGILVFLVLTLLLVYFNRYNSVVNLLFGRVFGSRMEEVGEIASMNLGDSVQVAVYDDRLALLGAEGLTVISKSGKTDLTLSIPIISPVLKTSGNYLLAYSQNGRELCLVEGSQLVQRFTTTDEIICATVNESGRVAVATSDVSSLGSVTVYDATGTQLYKWYSGNSYIVDVALSGGGDRLAVCTLSVDKAGTGSSVLLFQFSAEKPYASISREDAMFSQVKFASDRAVIVLSDRYVARFADDGTEKWTYEYAGGVLDTYSFDDSGDMVFHIRNPQEYEASSVLVFLSENGRVTGEYITDMDVNYVSANSNMAALCNGRDLVVVNKNGRETTRTTLNRDIQKALMWGNTQIAVLTGNSVVLYQLK